MRTASFILVLTFVLSLSTGIAQAAAGLDMTQLELYKTGILNTINGILLPVLIAVSFIVFMYGIFNYFILGATNEEKRAQGRQLVLWGVIAFVVIFSIWGLVALVQGTLGFGSGGTHPPPPTF